MVSRSAVRKARLINPNLYIVARPEDVDLMKELDKEGVNMIVLPELEAALAWLQIPASVIQGYTDKVRHELYRPLRESQVNNKVVTQLRASWN